MLEQISLTEKQWKFGLYSEKPDIEKIVLKDEIMLPSTVSQMKKSPETGERSDGFLTDPRHFDGFAVYSRSADLALSAGSELFLVLERTRNSSVWINGKHAGTGNSLCCAHEYDITELVRDGENTITIMIDNIAYPVPGGHMTSPDTQTNWLGITGGVSVVRRGKIRAERVRISPDYRSSSVTVEGVLKGGSGIITAAVEGFAEMSVPMAMGFFSFVYPMDGAALWSEHNPVAYHMNIAVCGDTVRVPFGMRNFEAKGRDFLLNGEKIFLRGKHDGMIFPLTGAAPTDKESWLNVMGTAKEYGINHYRFHTCCPPEAAFDAADELGIYLEPELPFWGTVDAEITPAQQYLVDEGFRILDSFANHPSFFAMSLGNELWGSRERLDDILRGYKHYDARPLYTQGSNNFQFSPCVAENDDFFVGVRFSRERLFRGSYAMCDAPLGHIQTDAPNSDYTYDEHIRPESVSAEKSRGGTVEIQYGTGVKTVSLEDGNGQFIADVPVVSHEVGQYFMYPDYHEIGKYTGVLKPYNLEIFRERLEKAGLSEYADRFFRASGRLAACCYRSEIEAALRSKELAGFQLLDLQDFTGQGTALVGILNSFMENKGILSAGKWRSFCSDRVILGCLPKFVFAGGEKTAVQVKLYSYGKRAVIDPRVEISLEADGAEYDWQLAAEGSFKGGVFELGEAEIAFPAVEQGTKAVLKLLCGDLSNEYELWLFPASGRIPDCVTEWSEAKAELSKGEKVLFMPEKIAGEMSVEGTYCTDFWNYPMFSAISDSMNKPRPVGTLGLLIESGHPALKGFPAEMYSTPQWYDAVTDSRTVILDGTGIEPIVRTIDNCQRNHSLGMIFEARACGGKLLVCTAHLNRKISSVSCRALLESLAEYVSSEAFDPVQDADAAVLDKMFG